VSVIARSCKRRSNLIQDNLVDVLLTTLQSYQNSAQREYKDLRYAHWAQRTQLLKTLLGFMEEQLVSPLRTIHTITEHPQLSDAEKITRIRTLLHQHDEQQLAALREKVATKLSEEEYFTILKNYIVCWNYLYLSQKLAEITDPTLHETLLQAILHGSVVAWRHLNLLGEYNFSEAKLQDTVGIKPSKFLA
jgi:hypothetical protein